MPTINKKILLEALEIVKPGLANKDIIEQTTSFAFVNGRVVTYNDRISISSPVPELQDITGAIKADKLYPLLNKIKADEVEISLNENFEIVIKSGRIKASLTLEYEIKLPINNEDLTKRTGWKPLPANFAKGINFVMSAASRDMTRPILTCIHANESFVEATDSHKVAKYYLAGSIPTKPFLLSADVAVSLVRFNPTEIAEGKGWIHFRTAADSIMSCRTFDEKFVDTAPHLKMTGVEITLPMTMSEVLDRAGIFAKRDHLLDETIEISVENRRFKVKAKAEDGKYEEEANIKFDGEPFEFSITPYLLKDILSQTQLCQISKDKIKFESEEWIYLAMLRYRK